MRKLENRRIPNGTYGGVRGRRVSARLLLDSLFCPHDSKGPPLVISSGAACRYGADGKRSHDTLSREISLLHASWTIEEVDFSTLWRLCIESPSQPKLASSLHNKRLSYWRLTGFGRNDGDGRQRFCHSSPYEMTVCCLSTPSSRAEMHVGMGQMENALMIL